MWIRLFDFGRPAAVAVFAIVVMLGRSGPIGPERARPASPRFQPTVGTIALEVDQTLRLLDVETGELKPIRLLSSDSVRSAAASPWRDNRGRIHLLGQFRLRDADGQVMRSGLARYALPDLEPLDRVDIDLEPVGMPCWFPGLSPRAVYVATDFQLYRVSFDGQQARGNDGSERPIEPEPLAWRCKKPGDGEVLLSGPTWPSAAAMGGRLVVSLTYLRRRETGASFVAPQIWWLRLGDDGRAIEGAGRLIAPVRRGEYEPETVERFASISATPDGGLTVAYLTTQPNKNGYQLQFGPVVIDTATGVPLVEESAAVAVAQERAPYPPVFSPDGRWVYSIPIAGGTPDRAERHSVAEALARRPAR